MEDYEIWFGCYIQAHLPLSSPIMYQAATPGPPVQTPPVAGYRQLNTRHYDHTYTHKYLFF